MNVCHNCKGGIVDGGFKKRIQAECKQLERNRAYKLSKLDTKDKKKYRNQSAQVNNEFDSFLRSKRDESCRSSKCTYCQGSGMRRGRSGI